MVLGMKDLRKLSVLEAGGMSLRAPRVIGPLPRSNLVGGISNLRYSGVRPVMILKNRSFLLLVLRWDNGVKSTFSSNAFVDVLWYARVTARMALRFALSSVSDMSWDMLSQHTDAYSR